MDKKPLKYIVGLSFGIFWIAIYLFLYGGYMFNCIGDCPKPLTEIPIMFIVSFGLGYSGTIFYEKQIQLNKQMEEKQNDISRNQPNGLEV